MANFLSKLYEALDKPLFSKPSNFDLTSVPDPKDVIRELDDVLPTGFFDDASQSSYFMDRGKKETLIKEQNMLIQTYRKISLIPEVSDAIAEVVDEAIFSPGSEDIIELYFHGELPDALKEKLQSVLDNIQDKLNLKKNIYSMFYSFYVDGQLKLHTPFHRFGESEGTTRIKILSPLGLQFNFSKDQWEYVEVGTFQSGTKQVFSREEIIHIDSGIYSDGLILGNLHRAVKTANMLSTLEDMLIPLRFSRSVSRRVFNIDVSKLNPKKAEEILKNTQARFKYKKFYNIADGTISNQQHVAALTEDYWFPNRGGEKGTTVDTLDESGNLGELGDIEYIKTKLYSSLNVPISRMKTSGPSSAEFDFTSTNISREELKFYNFISRLRNQFLEIFYELMKRDLISQNIASEEEWETIKRVISIKFSTENKFFEKMEREQLAESIAMYGDIQDILGKYVSHEFFYKKVLKFTDEEMTEMLDAIENEKADKRFSKFYEE